MRKKSFEKRRDALRSSAHEKERKKKKIALGDVPTRARTRKKRSAWATESRRDLVWRVAGTHEGVTRVVVVGGVHQLAPAARKEPTG